MSIAHYFMGVSFCIQLTRRAQMGNCGMLDSVSAVVFIIKSLELGVTSYSFKYICGKVLFVMSLFDWCEQCSLWSVSNVILDGTSRRSGFHRQATGIYVINFLDWTWPDYLIRFIVSSLVCKIFVFAKIIIPTTIMHFLSTNYQLLWDYLSKPTWSWDGD